MERFDVRMLLLAIPAILTVLMAYLAYKAPIMPDDFIDSEQEKIMYNEQKETNKCA
jgi:hypothetical protein